MKRSAPAFFGYLAPGVAIAIFAGLLAFSLTRLSDVERTLRIDAATNMLWVLSRTEISGQRLAQTLARSESGQATQDETTLRHDLFLGRLNLLDAGPQRRRMAAMGFEAELDEAIRAAGGLEDLIETGGPEDLARAAQILESINATFGRAANAAMVTEWDDVADLLDQHRAQLDYVIVSLVGIAAAVAVLTGFLFYSHVTARRRTALLDRERSFSGLLVSGSDEGILAVDRNLVCTAWNAAAEKLFGWSAERAVGRKLAGISGFFELPEVAGAFAKGLDDTPVALTERLLFRPDAPAETYVDMSCFPLKDEEGGVFGAMAFIRDVTDRYEAQRALVRHRDRLEEQVALRTRELSEALERERGVSTLYSNFATMVSHQFRTPLAIVDSALQRLIRRRAQVGPDEIEGRAQKAREAVARLIRLVESTLDAARLDTGQFEINSQECDFPALAQSVCERQREDAPGREIILHVPKAPVVITCDPTHAEHILANLTGNAVKYAPPDTPVHLRIVTTATHAQCTVTNAGDGISPAEQAQLFTRYFRGANASGKSGTGVGLFMARALARMQDGDVELVGSRPGKTEFRLSLPLANGGRAVQPDESHTGKET